MLPSLDDIAGPIKNEISKSQDCKAAEMLRFLFSFCETNGDATEVQRKDEEIKLAFKQVQALANEPNTPLRENLDRA